MLKHRILTALALIPLVLLAVFYLPPLGLMALAGLVFLGCAWEWVAMTGANRDNFEKIAFAVSIVIVGLITYFLPLYWFLWVSVVMWLVGFYAIYRFSRQQSLPRLGFWQAGAVCWFMLIPAWLSFSVIRGITGSPVELLWLLLIIWGSDTGAYFAGRMFGKTPFAPKVSPKKTWEGFRGGALAVLILAIIDGAITRMDWWQWLRVVILFYVTFIFAVYGDLFESMIKRIYNCKDSGSILPGHGGLLDRLDSLFAAAPVYTLGLLLLSL